jgi:hypothetical protein
MKNVFLTSFLIFQLGLAFAQNEVGIKEKFWIQNPETTSLCCRFDPEYHSNATYHNGREFSFEDVSKGEYLILFTVRVLRTF